MESLCCDSGIIRFAENSIASCEQSGLHSRSDSKTNPRLHPLPLGKGEAKSNRRSNWDNLCDLPMCSSGLAGTKQHEFSTVCTRYAAPFRLAPLRGEDCLSPARRGAGGEGRAQFETRVSMHASLQRIISLNFTVDSKRLEPNDRIVGALRRLKASNYAPLAFKVRKRRQNCQSTTALATSNPLILLLSCVQTTRGR